MDQDEIVDLNSKPKVYIMKNPNYKGETYNKSILTNFIIKASFGYIKEERQANHLMWGIVIVLFLCSFFVLLSGEGGNIKNMNIPNGVMEPGGIVPKKYLK